MNALDKALQAACPCLMVPRYEPLALLQDDSHRFLIGGTGLFVEVRRPWLHAILKVTDSPIPLPYGTPPDLFSINLHGRALLGGGPWSAAADLRGRFGLSGLGAGAGGVGGARRRRSSAAARASRRLR